MCSLVHHIYVEVTLKPYTEARRMKDFKLVYLMRQMDKGEGDIYILDESGRQKGSITTM